MEKTEKHGRFLSVLRKILDYFCHTLLLEDYCSNGVVQSPISSLKKFKTFYTALWDMAYFSVYSQYHTDPNSEAFSLLPR